LVSELRAPLDQYKWQEEAKTKHGKKPHEMCRLKKLKTV